MTQDKIQQIMMQFEDKIPQDKKYILIKELEAIPDEKANSLLYANLHKPTEILLFSIFLGGFGVDRFMMGDTTLGVCKLLFGWLTCGIWPLVDIFLSYNESKEKNFNTIMQLLKK